MTEHLFNFLVKKFPNDAQLGSIMREFYVFKNKQNLIALSVIEKRFVHEKFQIVL